MAKTTKSKVDTKHPNYKEWQQELEQVDDCYTGSHAIRQKNDRYLGNRGGVRLSALGLKEVALPPFAEDTTDNLYKKHALFIDYTAKTHDAWVGLATRKPPVFEVPAQMEPMLPTLGGYGCSAEELFGKKFSALLKNGVYNSTVTWEMDRYNPDVFLPAVDLYKRIELINWLDDPYTNDPLLRVFEQDVFKEDPKDPYVPMAVKMYYEYVLLSVNSEGGVAYKKTDVHMMEGIPSIGAFLRVYEKEDKKKIPKLIHEEPFLYLDGSPLDYLPLSSNDTHGVNGKPCVPPLLPITDINISHYRNYAILEWTRYWSAPTPYVTGINSKSNMPVGLGPSTLMALPKDATAGYMEFSGRSMEEMRLALIEKEAIISKLGSQVILPAGAEQPEALRIRSAEQNASILSWIDATAESMTHELKLIAKQMQLSPDEIDKINVMPNKDLLDIRLTGQDITSLMELYNGGVLNLDGLVDQLRQGEINIMDEHMGDGVSLLMEVMDDNTGDSE